MKILCYDWKKIKNCCDFSPKIDKLKCENILETIQPMFEELLSYSFRILLEQFQKSFFSDEKQDATLIETFRYFPMYTIPFFFVEVLENIKSLYNEFHCQSCMCFNRINYEFLNSKQDLKNVHLSKFKQQCIFKTFEADLFRIVNSLYKWICQQSKNNLIITSCFFLSNDYKYLFILSCLKTIHSLTFLPDLKHCEVKTKCKIYKLSEEFLDLRQQFMDFYVNFVKTSTFHIHKDKFCVLEQLLM